MENLEYMKSNTADEIEYGFDEEISPNLVKTLMRRIKWTLTV